MSGGVDSSVTALMLHEGRAVVFDSLDDMAAQSLMSRRTYLRQFASATGTTPIKWLIDQRIQASLGLLESSSLSIEQIATRVGFESPVTYRHHFVRGMKTTPSGYRNCFTGGQLVDAPTQQ